MHITVAKFRHICPTCHSVVYPNQILFYTGPDEHTIECERCHDTPTELCVICAKDISAQARHYLNRHKNYCWDCATRNEAQK